MTEVISVRFKNKGKTYFFDPVGLEITDGDNVIVETAKGAEYACCSEGNHKVDDEAVIQPLRPVLRIATSADTDKYNELQKKEAEAFEICQDRIEKRGMEMKLVDVEYSFDDSKILFFFTSDGRVDFRDLVKDLAAVFKTRIELRQIGVRDEARMLGGLGICGRPFCCNQFLDEFHPVSIKMAKTQGLSLNPTKISGTCGRLMCCLKYEQNAYEDLIKKAPKVDSFVDTTSGKGSVVSINLLRRSAKVRLEDSGDTSLKSFDFDDLEILGGKARRAEYIAARDEGRLEEAGFKPSPKPVDSELPAVRPVLDETTVQQPSSVSAEHQQNTAKAEHSSRPPRHGKGHPKHGTSSKSTETDDVRKDQQADTQNVHVPNGKPSQNGSHSHSRRSRSGHKPKNHIAKPESARADSPIPQQKKADRPKTAEQSKGNSQGTSHSKPKHRYYRRKKAGTGNSGSTSKE